MAERAEPKRFAAYVLDVAATQRTLEDEGVPKNAAKDVAKAAAGIAGPLSISVAIHEDGEVAHSISQVAADFDPKAVDAALHKFETDAKVEALQKQVDALVARLDG
jgi:hypothetical protein